MSLGTDETLLNDIYTREQQMLHSQRANAAELELLSMMEQQEQNNLTSGCDALLGRDAAAMPMLGGALDCGAGTASGLLQPSSRYGSFPSVRQDYTVRGLGVLQVDHFILDIWS